MNLLYKILDFVPAVLKAWGKHERKTELEDYTFAVRVREHMRERERLRKENRPNK